MEDIPGNIIVLVVLILFSAYFSATETAFSSLNRIKIKNMAQDGDKRAKRTLKLCDKYDNLLSTILIGNNIVNIMSTSIATALFVSLLSGSGVAVSTVVMTVVVLIFGEIVPKSMAKEAPESFAMFSAPIISVFLWILTPVNWFFTQLKSVIKRVFKIDGGDSITDRELLTMVEEAKKDGGIDEEEGHLLISAIEFYDLEVSDILTPRVNVSAVDIEDSREEIRREFRRTGYSRLPVYKETIDNVVGIINEKDFHYTEDIKSIITPAVFVHENMKISKLLSLLQKKKSHLAIVTDEYGGTVGIVSLEDILEELVGEIWDEHDRVREDFVKLTNNRYRVSADANLDRMLGIFELAEEEDVESTTVGGWIIEKLGHLPKKGERLETDTLSVLVTKAEQNRVKEAIVIRKNLD